MHLNNPVNKNAPHPLTNVWLVLHVFDLWLILKLSPQVVFHDVSSEFGHILRVLIGGDVALENGALQV